jgi:hypothetical protein
MEEPENSDIALVILAGVLSGIFNRTADDIISVASDQLPKSGGEAVDANI